MSLLTVLDMSDPENIKDALWQLDRATNTVALATWATRYGRALGDFARDPMAHGWIREENSRVKLANSEAEMARDDRDEIQKEMDEMKASVIAAITDLQDAIK